MNESRAQKGFWRKMEDGGEVIAGGSWRRFVGKNPWLWNRRGRNICVYVWNVDLSSSS